MKRRKWRSKDVLGILLDPFYAININEGLFGEHEPIISKDQWVRVQVKLIDELGKKQYFMKLLEVLEGGFIK